MLCGPWNYAERGNEGAVTAGVLQRRTTHSSEGVEEGEDGVGGVVAKSSGRGLLQSFKRALLHGEVCFDVAVCGSRTFVAEPEGDDGDVDPGLQQVHRGRVAEGVW